MCDPKFGLAYAVIRHYCHQFFELIVRILHQLGKFQEEDWNIKFDQRIHSPIELTSEFLFLLVGIVRMQQGTRIMQRIDASPLRLEINSASAFRRLEEVAHWDDGGI